ncbi:MAG: acetylglutamate kinase [Bacteroidaceae bacterium]|nr:acetylglutamate kinase [Bacteroidaceae bacterium]
MKEKLTIIKVGGKIVENPDSLAALLDQFAALEGCKILVHGGGRTATDMAARLGVETTMVNGRRITDAAMLDVVTMVYAGLVNKNVVAKLQARGVNALGLTGADMNVIASVKRPVKDVNYGFVGDVQQVDGQRLAQLLNSGITPVMAPLTHDGLGNMLNTNADTIAGETAKACAKHFETTLIYCFEFPGVMSNPDDLNSVIPHINSVTFEQLKTDGTVSGGMIPKIENALAAVEAGVHQVIIRHADHLAVGGTTIK